MLRHFSENCTVPFEGFTMQCDLEIEIYMILRQFLGKNGRTQTVSMSWD